MSEYMEKHAVARLIGAPPGYVGFEEGGQLTEAVRRRPYSVMLFDEIEKAHPDVFNILLQILDDGRLTDSQGRTVDFRNTVDHHDVEHREPRTSWSMRRADWARGGGAGARGAAAALPARVPQPRGRHDRLPSAGRRADRRGSSSCSCDRLERLLAERKLTIELTPEARRAIAAEGYDPAYGARPLKRALQRMMQNPLAMGVLEGKFKDGDHILVQAGPDGALTFNVAPPASRRRDQRRLGPARDPRRACGGWPPALGNQWPVRAAGRSTAR